MTPEKPWLDEKMEDPQFRAGMAREARLMRGEALVESKVICPHCSRKPGGVHRDACPRSQASQAALSDAMAALGRPRPFYPAKGVFMVLNARGISSSGVNPGVPFVRSPKPRTAGGLPQGHLRLPTKRNHITGIVLEWTVIEAKRAAEIFLEDFGELGREMTIELGRNTIPLEGPEVKAVE